MTKAEERRKMLANGQKFNNTPSAQSITTANVETKAEQRRRMLNTANQSLPKFNSIIENGQKMKINMTPTQAIIEKGKQLYQEPNMLKNIKPEMSHAGDVVDKENILKKDSEYLQQTKKQKLEKMNQRTNELIAMTYKNKLANGVNLADDKNVITSLMGRQLGQRPSDKGNLLKVPENMKDNNRRFEDGYQFGDISKTALENLGDSAVAIGSTALEVPARLVKGILSVPEGIANAGASIVAGISDMVGQDDYANELRRRVAMGTPFVKTHAFMNNAIDKLNSNSFSGNLLDSATEGIGQSTAQMAVGSAIGKFGEVPIKFGEHTLNMPTTAFVTGMGNSASETYAKADEQLGGIENATGKEKLQMALRILRGGTVEGVSEGLFGLLGVGGTDITEEFAKKAVAKAETAFEKQLTKIIIAGGGEAAEEFISYASNYLLDNYANKFGKLDFSENWNWDDVMQEMASAFISSGISQGVTSAVQINKATQNAIQLAEREQGRQLTTQEISEIRNSVANEVLGAREELENTQNSANINENTPNIEQISQNNVQNVSDLEKSQQYSIQTDTNGNKYIKVDTDQDIFKNIERDSSIVEQKIKAIEKNDNAIYNETGGVENGRVEYKLSKLVERESKNIEETEKILKAQQQITEKSLTLQQKNTKNTAKEKYNKNIIYYDGNNVTSKGLTTKTNDIYIDNESSKAYGSDFVLGHEIAEDMIINHSNEVMEEFDNLIMEIQKSKSFTQMYKEYAQTLSSKQKQDLVFRLDKVAKEILCDINGGRNTNQSQDITEQIKKQLGEELYNKIVSSLDKYEKQIYKSSEEQGSFLMPTNVNNISLNDEMFDFYQQVSTNSNYSTTFKQRIGEMLEKTKSRAQFEKIKETVANYKTNLSSSEVDKRTSEVRKYIDKQNSVISTKGLKMKNGDIINTIVNNVGMSKKYNHKTLNRIAGEISNLLYNGELTDAKIEQIVKDLGENVQTTIDEYYEANKELKKTIQKTKVYVSENVKKGFGDWNDFRRNSMGNVRLTNDSNALPIDTFYMELSDTYGDDVFPSNIVNASDQLQKIVEVSKQIKKTDMNFEKYVEQTYGKNAWGETARQLAEAIKGIRTELGKNGMYIEAPESKGGIKKRSWTETTQNNDLVKNFLDVKELKYQVKTNSSTVKSANATLDNLGYDVAYENFASNMKAGRRMTANDIALGERLIQESIKNGEFEKATNLIYDVTILGTELGQAVQAMRLISRLSPEGQLAYLQKAVDRINAKKNVKKIAQKEYHNLEKYETKVENGAQTKLNDFKNIKSSNLDNYETKVENGIQTKIDTYDSKGIVIPVELRNNLLGAQTAEEIEKAVDRIKQSIADQMPVEFVEKANEWRYLSMLGNPKTHIRNILSNVAMRGTYASKNVIQRTIEQVTSPLLEERTRTFKKASEEVKKFAKQSAIDNRDAINGGGKLGIDQEIKAMRSVFKNEPLEQLRKFNSKMLDAEDLFFSQSAYANNLAEYLTANGIRTQQDIDLNPDVVEKGINFATLEAQKTTFRQYSKLANLLNQAEGSNTFANLVIGGIVPFKKTPINIAKTGASYSPLGLIETLTNETVKLKKGTITANEYIDRLSQGITGTALTALGYVLASAGVLNGSSDDDKDKYNKLVGAKAPYTIKLGKTSFDLSWISPSAMPMFMGTELYEGLKNKDNKFDWNEIVNFTAKTIDPLSEMSMISGVNDAIKSYSSNDTSTGAISNIFKSSIKSYLGQYFPTIVSQFNKVIDKNIKSTKASKNSSFKDLESIVRQNANKVPFASMLLEPSTDVWGNEKERNDNILLRALDAFVNPGNITEENITDVDKEIMALYDASRNADIVPKIPKDYFNSNGYKYEMSAKEYTQFKKKYGQTAYEELEKLFKTKEYRDMDSDKKEKAIEDVYDYAKEKARENYGFNAEDIIDKYGEEEGALRLINKETIPKYEKAKDAGIPLVDFYNAWVAQKNAEGKKNARGETIDKTEKRAKIKAINSAVDDDLTTYQKKALYRIFNVN